MYLTATKIKGRIKNMAKQNNSDPISLLRIYMMERFLERVSISKYKDDFIIKGGILVTSLIGISSRATMDIDTTIRNFDLKVEKIKNIINEIKNIELDDHIAFELGEVSNIMDNMEYPGIRIHMNAKLETLNVPIKIDISTGDIITPCEVSYSYPLLLENRSISLWSYNLETILAEKIQTVLSRGTTNTRMRDYYDITVLYTQYKDKINYPNLSLAFKRVCKRRSTESLLSSCSILEEISDDISLQNLWKQYCIKYRYAKNIDFQTNVEVIRILMNKITCTS